MRGKTIFKDQSLTPNSNNLTGRKRPAPPQSATKSQSKRFKTSSDDK